MKKGRFGLVLCFYPIAAFAAVILKQPLLCLALLGFAVFLEKDEWAGRQTIQATALALLVSFFDQMVPWFVSLFNLTFLAGFFNIVTSVLLALIYLAAIVLSVLGILRVMKDREANIPLASDLAYRLYGQQKPRPIPMQGIPPYGVQPPMGQVPPQQQPETASPMAAQPNIPQENGPHFHEDPQ